MPIDTRNKRASAIFPLLPFRGMLPAPDGTIGQADRQQVVFLYAGILAAAPAAGIPGVMPLIVSSRSFQLVAGERSFQLVVDDSR